ncbi:sugar transferase [Pseudocalidococcus azoricus]|uniref:sugar transferase n=1 Tax=Pseudocalidococcus azoricus TaxID=3110322 RepID=UPI002AF6A22B|nr:sugar transferase [Pseudocalidococcus azoricus]
MGGNVFPGLAKKLASRSGERDIRAPHPVQLSWLFSQQGYQTLLLLSCDLLALVGAWKLGLKFNRLYSPIPPELVWWEWFGLPSLFWGFALGILLILAMGGLYHPRRDWKNYLRAGQLVSLGYILSLVISYCYDPTLDMPRSLFFMAWIGSVILVIGLRLLATLVTQLRAYQQQVRVFLIAPAERLELLLHTLEKQSHYAIVGTAQANAAYAPETWQAILQANPQEVLAANLPPTDLASTLYWQLRQRGIHLRLVPSSLDILYRRGVPEIFAALPTLRAEVTYLNGLEYRLKRGLDVVGALLGVVLLAPVFIVVAVGIRITSPGPVFFCQERVGLRGRVFQMWKFRTMDCNAHHRQAELETANESCDGILFKIKDDPRITPFGRWLRRTSIDELPQLFNILFGQMSLVGPRPLPVRDVQRFNSWHHIRHHVLPGITGLWQISGRSKIGQFDEAARLDLYYIDNWSFNLDLEILVETLRIVLFQQGAY